MDSIAQGITKSGQEVPLSVEMLSNGWGDIIDKHVRASRGRELKTRCLVARHLISNCIKFYLMCIDDSHRLAYFKPVVDDMANAYANFIRTDDAEANDDDRHKSTEYMKIMVKSVMQHIVPYALEMWASQAGGDVGGILGAMGVDSHETGIDSFLG